MNRLMLTAETLMPQGAGGGAGAGQPAAAFPAAPPPPPAPSAAPAALAQEAGGSGFGRFSRAEWLMAGFELLAREGESALRPPLLAAHLGGPLVSFYWHFRKIEGFHQALLDTWELIALGAMAARPGQPAAERLAELASEAADGGAAGSDSAFAGAEGPELAIRAWALYDPAAAKALARVDAHRLAEVTALLCAAGLPEQKARERAEVFYAARLGFDALRRSARLPGLKPMRALTAAILGLSALPEPEAAPPPLFARSGGGARLREAV